jgi:flagellar motor switch protein FliM
MVTVKKKCGSVWETVRDISQLSQGDVVKVQRNNDTSVVTLQNKPVWDEFGGWMIEEQEGNNGIHKDQG